MAQAVKKVGKTLHRGLAKSTKRRRRAQQQAEEEVDVEEEAAHGRRRRHRSRQARRQLQDPAASSEPKPEPMQIQLDFHVGDPLTASAAMADDEPSTDEPPVGQHRTLILGVALGGGFLLLAVAAVMVRNAYQKRQEEAAWQQERARQLEAVSPKRKRPMELGSVGPNGAGENGVPSPSLISAGRLASERGSKKIMAKTESYVESTRSPATARGGSGFQLKEIDLAGGVQSPGRGGPGMFSPRVSER